MVEKRPFVEVVLGEGKINTLLGPPGSGKTNFANFLMERAIERNMTCLTNVNYFMTQEDISEAIARGFLPGGVEYLKIPKQLIVVRKLSDLILSLLKTERNVVFLDEAALFASSTNPMSGKVRQVKELAYIIRHLQSSFILICQAKKSIAPDLRSTLVTYEMRIRKIRKSNYRVVKISEARIVKMGFNDDDEEIEFVAVDEIGRIPLTRLPWDGYFLPKFEFDINLTEAFNRLGEYNSLEIRRNDLGISIVNELKNEGLDNGRKTRDDISEEFNDVRELARKRFEEMVDNDEFDGKRSAMISNLAREFKKSQSWATGVARTVDKKKSY